MNKIYFSVSLFVLLSVFLFFLFFLLCLVVCNVNQNTKSTNIIEFVYTQKKIHIMKSMMLFCYSSLE